MATVKVPLWDGANTLSLEGIRTYAAVDLEIALLDLLTDEFGADTEQDIATGGDGAKSYGWNVLNSAAADAIDVNTTNAGKLTIDCDATSTDVSAGGVTAPYIYKEVDGTNLDVEISFSDNADAGYEKTGLLIRDTDVSANEDYLAILRYHSGAGFAVYIQYVANGVETYGVNTVVSDSFLRIKKAGTSITYYSKATAGAAWTSRGSTTVSGWSGTVQLGVYAATNNTSNNFVSQIDYMRGVDAQYDSASPSPTAVWTALPAGSVVDMSTLFIPENMNTGDAGTVKYQYALNGGALNGTWLTQAQLQAESDPTITDATSSIKIVPQYVSDGTQLTTSQAYAVVDVTLAAGGGLLTHPGMAGGMRG